MKRTATVLAAVLAAAVVAAYASRDDSPTRGSTSVPQTAQSHTKAGAELRDVESVDQLRTLFNAQSQEPRLIVLASPT
jgi:hypothetical protein